MLGPHEHRRVTRSDAAPGSSKIDAALYGISGMAVGRAEGRASLVLESLRART
jgi:hypothetical protein